MDCQRAQLELDAVNADAPETALAAEVRGHLAICPACRAFAAGVARLRVELRAEALPPLPTRLRRASTMPARATVAYRLAMAAGLLLALGAFALLGIWSRPTHPAGAGVVSADPEIRTITLALDSHTALHGVTLRVMLPPGVAFDGHPGVSELEWQTDLAAGANRLRLPLRVPPDAEGDLVTRIEYEGRERELSVPLAAPPQKVGTEKPNTRG